MRVTWIYFSHVGWGAVGHIVQLPFPLRIVLAFNAKSPASLIQWSIWHTIAVNFGNQFMLTHIHEAFLAILLSASAAHMLVVILHIMPIFCVLKHISFALIINPEAPFGWLPILFYNPKYTVGITYMWLIVVWFIKLFQDRQSISFL